MFKGQVQSYAHYWAPARRRSRSPGRGQHWIDEVPFMAQESSFFTEKKRAEEVNLKNVTVEEQMGVHDAMAKEPAAWIDEGAVVPVPVP